MESKVRAAIYARVSTEEQLLGSGLEVQVQACRRFATQRDYEVVEVFADEGVSGAQGLENREALERLFMAARERRFSVVIFHEMDRIARDLIVGMGILAKAAEAGIRLVEATSGASFDGAGALQHLVKVWAADDDRRKLLQRTKQGHIARAKSGKVSGPPPLGYDRDADSRLVINEDEAKLVRRIFSLYVDEGRGFEAIAQILNAEGVQTKRAKMNAQGKNRYRGAEHWQLSTIKCVINNPVYAGRAVYGKTHGRVRAGQEPVTDAKRPVTRKETITALKNRQFMPHEQVEIAVPPIIDEVTWERAQAVRSARFGKMAFKGGPTKYVYDLNGIVCCSACNRLMARMTMSRTRKDGSSASHSYYTCRNARCANVHRHHRMDRVNIEIMSRLVPFLANPERIRESLASQVETLKQDRTMLLGQRKQKEQHLLELDKRLQKLRDAYAAGFITLEELGADRQRLDADKAETARELAGLEARLAALEATDEERRLEQVIKMIAKMAAELDDPSFTLYALFRNRVPNAMRLLDLPTKEAVNLAPAIPDPKSPDGLAARKFLAVLHALISKVTINEEGQIAEYKLRISDPPPSRDDVTSSDGYIANRKCITSPSLTS